MTELQFDKARWQMDSDGDWLCIRCSRAQAQRVVEAADKKKQTAVIKEYREKRSLDANAYAWVLIGRLAEHHGLTPEDVYRQEIRTAGPYEVLPVREDAAERWPAIWGGGGTGFVCEDMGPSKLPGYRNFRCWYGSHVYDTKQMARLIDEIVRDCRDAGIETLPPDKLALLKEEWENC